MNQISPGMLSGLMSLLPAFSSQNLPSVVERRARTGVFWVHMRSEMFCNWHLGHHVKNAVVRRSDLEVLDTMAKRLMVARRRCAWSSDELGGHSLANTWARRTPLGFADASWTGFEGALDVLALGPPPGMQAPDHGGATCHAARPTTWCCPGRSGRIRLNDGRDVGGHAHGLLGLRSHWCTASRPDDGARPGRPARQSRA